MKQVLLLFFTTLLLGFNPISSMNKDKNPKKGALRFAPRNSDYDSYIGSLKTKSADELKVMLGKLILQDYNSLEDPNKLAHEIALVMRELDIKNASIEFTKDDIQLLNKLIIFNSFEKAKDLIEWLLNHGMPVNTITPDPVFDGQEKTPLTLAIESRNTEIVTLLLDYGADQNIEITVQNPRFKDTPRTLAEDNKDLEMLAILDKYQKNTPNPTRSIGTPVISSIPVSSNTKKGSNVITPASSISKPTTTTNSHLNSEQKLSAMNNQQLAELLEESFENDNESSIPSIWDEIQRRDPVKPYTITFTNQKMLAYLITEDVLSNINNNLRMSLIRGLIDRGIPINGSNNYTKSTPLVLAIRLEFPEKVALLLQLGAATDIPSSGTNKILPRQEAERFREKNPAYTEKILQLLNQHDTANGTPITTTPISPSSTSTSSGIATSTSSGSATPTAQWLHWNITKGKIIATLISAGWIAALYRWWTGSSTVERQENVLVNNTGATIFIRGSQDAIAPNTTYALPESGILSITLDADQDEAHDLKIDMADYADDLEDSYLNLTIRKKWFSNWFTVPLFYAPYWIDKKQD